ncbi:MAG: type II toxin-antitoxin system death-on-curing family toxin [Tepidisphaeraceae bacterium]
MDGLIFLTLDQVLRLHARQIEQFGGSDGIRAIELIESAIAQPQQGLGGEYFHKTLAEMAAAYLFHLVKNHGFVDANKRTGAAAALTFLEMNGIDTDGIDENEMEATTLSVEDGTTDKNAATIFFTARINVVK